MARIEAMVNNRPQPTVPSPQHKPSASRAPIVFVIALITMWLLGMHAVVEGVRAIDIVRSPLSESLSAFEGDEVSDAMQRAFIEGVSAHSQVTLPVGIAQLLLGALLALVSIRGLLGRRGSLGFALQVLAANALLVLIVYLAHDPVRGSVIEALVAELMDQRPPDIARAEFESVSRTSLIWGFRFSLSAQLIGFGFAGFVMTRRSVRHLFDHPGKSHDG
jgi:hypothetical protein